MNGVREWAAVICMAALAAAMLQSLAPGGSMERMARFVIGAFVICAMIAPISKALPQLRLGLERVSPGAREDGRLNSTVKRQYRDAAEQSVKGLVAAEVGRMGIKCKNVQVIMDTDENGSISITKVVVTIGKESAAGRANVSSALQKTLGIQTEVVSDEG